MRSHIQTMNYSIQIGDTVIKKVAIFNTNKLPTGIAVKCIETDTYNKYLLTMSEEQYNAIFLDDGEYNPELPVEESNVVNESQESE